MNFCVNDDFLLYLQNCLSYCLTFLVSNYKANNIRDTWNGTKPLKMRNHASKVQDIFCLKSWIEGRRIHQLGSTANLARIRLKEYPQIVINQCCLGAGFHAFYPIFLTKKILSLLNMPFNPARFSLKVRVSNLIFTLSNQ